MGPAPLAFALLSALALSADAMTKTTNGGSDAFPRVTAAVPGYRRALQKEITPAMYQEAIRAVSPGATKLGDVLYYDGFAIAMETHHNETKGAHKGASIFVPA